ncbi:hypothetical protein QCA50_015373 [Cerrena zonata]|uniref:Uncharacterized protein n=1 Tax=Cerrena zonata TaxID=2478898 RepID=A0AAW0FTR2_9APHY
MHFSKDTLNTIGINSDSPRRLPWDKSHAIRPPNLAPFLTLPYISSFDMEASWCFDLDDEFLRTMAIAWPHLESFTIDPAGSWPKSADCRLTVAGLLPIVQHCSRISAISCRLEGNVPSVYSAGDVYEDAKFEPAKDVLCLTVGDSCVSDVENVAVYIYKMFPYLEEIYSWDDKDNDEQPNREMWDSVECWVKRLGTVCYQERKRAHAKYCKEDNCSHLKEI